jgi:hypothetical protein
MGLGGKDVGRLGVRLKVVVRWSDPLLALYAQYQFNRAARSNGKNIVGLFVPRSCSRMTADLSRVRHTSATTTYKASYTYLERICSGTLWRLARFMNTV